MKSTISKPDQNKIREESKRNESQVIGEYFHHPKKHHRIEQIVFAALLFAALVSCNSTKIVTSWRDPEVVVNSAQLNKFVVAALLKNQAVRRRTEDLMASYYAGKAVQSYKELGEAELKENNEFYNQKLKREGFDGMVVMRLLQVDKDRRYVPGNYPAYYRSWGFYYGNAWSGFYMPGYYTTDKTYNVEVNIYSFKRDKLVWSAITSTVNPAGRDKLYDDVIKVVKKRMKKEGFLK